ncbi:MAG TPA: hypothetical protein VF746_16325 [Longimicrobium sp.]|jgi:hypothetical protein
MPILLGLISLAARLVPAPARGDWAREWHAELLHRRAWLERRGALGWAARLDLALRVLGALPDALAVRRIAAERGAAAPGVFAAHPLRAAAAVAVLAAAAVMETVGFAAATAVRGPVPAVAVAAALAAGVGVLAAAAHAAATLLGGVPARAFSLRPRLHPPSPDTRSAADSAALVLAGSGAGLALALAAALAPPTDGAARVLGGGLGAGALTFHAGVSLALGLLLSLRLRRAPSG